jgi:ABC-type branched-subunit amino acid transport system substrate-binding protein
LQTHRWLNTGRIVLAAVLAAALTACAQQGKVDRGDEPGQGQPGAEIIELDSDRAPPTSEELEPQPDGPGTGEVELTPPDGVAARHKVAILLPLSGPRQELGEAMLQAAQLGLFDTAGENFALIVRDTEGTAEGAEAAAREAVDAGAELILGPVFSKSVEAVAPVAQGAAVPVMAFSNNRKVARPGVYVLGWLPSEQVERVLGYAVSQGLRRFAVLAPSNDYGDLIVNAMETSAPRLGGELARVAYYDTASPDVSAPIKRLSDYEKRRAALRQRIAQLENQGTAAAKRELEELKNMDALGSAPFDAVMVPAGGKELQTIAPTLPFYDVDPDEVQFLGTAQWNDPSLGTEPALVGGWFVAPSPSGWDSFKSRYDRTFGTAPPRLASLAYDATALAALLARRAANDDTREPGQPVYDTATLTMPSGFAGVDGVFRMRQDGLVERRYAVMEMRRNALKVLDPAPTDFRTLTY